MTGFTRETYYAALFVQLQGLKTAGTVVTINRKVRLLNAMEPAELPALFLAVAKQRMPRVTNQPATHHLNAHVYLYAANPDPNVSADMALNGLLDALEAALAPPPAQPNQTLGGLVQYVKMADAQDIEVFAGPNGERAAAIVPIEMLVP